MSNEELEQRKYIVDGKLKGTRFGDYEELNIGGSHAKDLKAAGLKVTIPKSVGFPFREYDAPKSTGLARPDRVYFQRTDKGLIPVATAENKSKVKSATPKHVVEAAEQALFGAAVMGVGVAVSPQNGKDLYIDVHGSLKAKQLVFFTEPRDFSPGVLTELLSGKPGASKDPGPLAERVWQIIWHATQEEPKSCLLTFVEIFVLKFLSDNLPVKVLPETFRFYGLLADPQSFESAHGVTAIEYYVQRIRPYIKSLFPDNTIAADPSIPAVFGVKTIVSKTSVINGFAFLKGSSSTTLAGSNKVFTEILEEFQKFGPLTSIDPEFKLRLYEKFLKRSSRQQKLGQFFTPRNVVQQMIRMARLDTLADGAVVLDPAAGVGGFILEPSVLLPSLAKNADFAAGKVTRRIKFIGVDVDANTHILAKANVLIHYAEALHNPAITMGALNQLMAETFVLMNQNTVLGALENPPKASVDVILTNPPYVTRGSGTHKQAIIDAGTSDNGTDLQDYYDRAGLGLEALFLRYIAGALKPGGRAFVIVPLGLLNRTESGPKLRILNECNLLASIALPRNTFFNTSQLTYILVLEKRHTEADGRPAVLCGIARSIGETLDWERTPAPDDNALALIADDFVGLTSGTLPTPKNGTIVKVVPATEFSENHRWDVPRFWTEEELVALGQRESAVTRLDFIDEVQGELTEIVEELGRTKADIQGLTSAAMKATFSLGDVANFTVRSGARITTKEVREHPGDLPIYSCFKNEWVKKGDASESFFVAQKGGVAETKPLVAINANGASVGKVYVRRDRCGLTDDVIAVDVNRPGIDIDYLAVALREAIGRGGFLYEAKLFAARVRELSVEIPVTHDGKLDEDLQQKIAAAIRRFDTLLARLHELGVRSDSVRAI